MGVEKRAEKFRREKKLVSAGTESKKKKDHCARSAMPMTAKKQPR